MFAVLTAAMKIDVIDSAIGPVAEALLNFVANYVLKHYVIPELNKAGSRGIPLPVLDHVRFINTGLQLQQNAMCVSTDLRYVGDADSANDDGDNNFGLTFSQHQESQKDFEVSRNFGDNFNGNLRL